jgi:Fe-S cluster assembly protein SufD
MTTSTHITNPKEEFLSNFIPQEFPDNARLQQIKAEAENALDQLDFPTTRDEQWKYTRISKILKKKYTQSPAKNTAGLNFFKVPEAHLFVFINGFFSAELSNPGKEDGAVILPLSKARKENIECFEKYFGKAARHKTEIFTALNTVHHTNGVFIFLNDNIALKKPVHIVNIGASANAAFNPRNLIILGKNSSADIISSFESVSNEGSFANVVSEIFMEERSKLTFYLLQNESENAYQVNTLEVALKSGSNAEFFSIAAGGSLLRNNLNVSLNGENCIAHLHGLYMGKNEQHFDNHTMVEHKKPSSFSNEMYKGVMNGKSTGVFNGKVLVYKDAQKTNAYQSNQNILLSDDASINSKPELEIYANDVK